MTFPVTFLTDVPVWYNIVGNILGLVVIVITVIFIVVADEDDLDFVAYNTFLGIIVVIIIATVIAIFVAAFWVSIPIIGIPALIIYGIRKGYITTKEYIYYRKYDM